GPLFGERAAELGLPEARLAYDATAPTAAELEARIDRDTTRGFTGLGPHLDDVAIAAGPRDLRSFGSQGEQRVAVLALLLGGPAPPRRAPLRLLDAALSELDPGRRRALAARVAQLGQVVIPAPHRSLLPAEPAQVVEVSPGQAR